MTSVEQTSDPADSKANMVERIEALLGRELIQEEKLMVLLFADGDTPEHFASSYLRDDLAGRRVMQKVVDPDGGEHIELRILPPGALVTKTTGGEH